jgi:ABC-type sugar transport system ATPase subunit
VGDPHLNTQPSRLTLVDVRKSFGETRALNGISLEVLGGEIVGVAGPNGAGKTTLLRIIAGEDQVDDGKILLNGTEVSAAIATRQVSVVHQEVRLFGNLSVAQNLLVGRSREGWRRWPRPGERELAILEELGLGSVANVELGACSLVVQQLTEIGRTLIREDAAHVFLFDEPNSALTDAESRQLFHHVHKLKEAGNIVLLVTHRLGELVEHADRVVVIRDGTCAAILEAGSLSEAAVARELVVEGRAVQVPSLRVRPPRPEPAWRCSISRWAHKQGAFKAVSFEFGAGDIIALVGVEGSGIRELIRSFAGFEAVSGSMQFSGQVADHPAMEFLPAERWRSLYSNFSIGKNLTSRLGRGEIASRWGYLLVSRMRAIAVQLVERFRIRSRSVADLITALSGGNQQKVGIAAAIAARPTLLVLEEPTRGVDVGSKAEIYRMLHEFADGGGAIITLCTEVPEVFELASRVLVVKMGEVGADMPVRSFPDVTALAERVAAVGQSGTYRSA